MRQHPANLNVEPPNSRVISVQPIPYHDRAGIKPSPQFSGYPATLSKLSSSTITTTYDRPYPTENTCEVLDPSRTCCRLSTNVPSLHPFISSLSTHVSSIQATQKVKTLQPLLVSELSIANLNVASFLPTCYTLIL